MTSFTSQVFLKCVKISIKFKRAQGIIDCGIGNLSFCNFIACKALPLRCYSNTLYNNTNRTYQLESNAWIHHAITKPNESGNDNVLRNLYLIVK